MHALSAYRIRPSSVMLLGHLENTTYRVDAVDGQRYVLRIERTTGSPLHPVRGADEVRSELLWVSAVRRDTALAVPEPVPAADGSPLTIVEMDGVPGPRICVVLRWQPGRFLEAGLTPGHLERVGEFTARLHAHAAGFVPPAGFSRWRIEEVSDRAAAYASDLVGEHAGRAAASVVEAVVDQVRAAERELGTGPDVFGLIHSDLHQENYLFDRGQVRAIDFDDCGWGHFVYDLAVTISEVRWRADNEALRAALLRGYRASRSLPAGDERYLEIFHALRVLKLTLWIVEQRDHPGFDAWESDVRESVADLRKIVDRVAAGG